MNDKTLVERLDTAIKDDHERGCQGRFYSCTCGYDNDCSQAMQDAKSRIEALEAALRIEIWNGLKRNGMSDDAATAMVKERMAALESQP